jgi:hypothetical protein
MSTDTTETTDTTAPAAKKGGRRKLVVAGVLIGTALIGFAAGKGGSGTATAAPAPAPITQTVTAPALTVTQPAPPPVTVTAAPVTVTVEPPAPVVSGPAEEITKSGIFVVGTDIKAGKWRSDGKISEARSTGYFAILADPTGSTSDVDNILSNDNPDGQAFATLEDGQGLESNNLHWTYMG